MTYLDHAATTPVLPSVITAMAQVQGSPGNASSLHGAGRRARRLVEESREHVAAALGAHPSEVIFTSGGTEADNIAVAGIFHARRQEDPARRRILVSTVEHHAVSETVEDLAAHHGAVIGWLEVDAAGRVRPEVLAAAVDENPSDVALVTVMWANNEVGAVNPIADLAEIAHRYGIPLHTDAVQAVGQLPVDFAASGADALSLSAHKLGGPTGTGALLARRDLTLRPVQFGGGQERGIRSGTVNVAGIVGLATALSELVAHRTDLATKLRKLRDDFITRVTSRIDGVTVSGTPDGLPGVAHLRFDGCLGESLLMLLDTRGIECSAGSACTAGVTRASHVLLAMGVPEADALGALRFSLGHTSTAADVDAAVEALEAVVPLARSAGRRAG